MLCFHRLWQEKMNTTSSYSKSFWSSIYPWLIWGISSSFLFYKYLLEVSPSVMVEELMREFSLSGAAMGNLAAYYFYAYLVMQLPTGILLDRFSPRRLITGAIMVCAGGAWLFSKANTLGMAEIGRLLIGIGGAFSAVGTMKLITLWFPPQRFAWVSGLMMTVGMLGAVGGETPLAYSVSLLGWRTTMALGAVVGALLALLLWFLVRDHREQEIIEHEEIPEIKSGFLFYLTELMKKPSSWLISLYSGLAFAPISSFGGLWGVPFLMEEYHLTRPSAAGLTSLIFIGFAMGSPLAGWWSDKIRRRKPVMVVGTVLGMAMLLLVLYSPTKSTLLLGILLWGFGYFTSFFFVSFAYMREINNPRSSGMSIGFINMFNAACGALSEPLIGKLLDMRWDHHMLHGVRWFSIENYQHALTALPIGMLLALILLLFIKETFCQSTGR